MATRTAPTVDGTPTSKLVSFRWIDVSGDVRTDSMYVPTTATDAQIEAMAVALQAGSNASLHSVMVELQYGSVPDASNATAGSKSESVHDQLFFVAKNSDPFKIVQRAYFPAPISDLFIADSDNLNPAETKITDLLTAFLAVIGAGYSIVWGRYTEKSEINEKTPI